MSRKPRRRRCWRRCGRFSKKSYRKRISASVRIVPEKPAKAKLCFGKMCNLASKPARKVVRLVPNKKLRELQ